MKKYWDYPYTIHINALLLDDKIIGWKVGRTHWDTSDSAFNNRQLMTAIYATRDCPESLSVNSISFVCKNNKDSELTFNERSTEFYKMWEIHPKFSGFEPY